MKTQKQKCFLALYLAICGLSVTTHAEDKPQFYARYTRLDYDQPPDPALLGQIPVNAAKVFAGDQADKADQVPRPPETGEVHWGKYADLVVNVAAGHRLVFARSSGYLPCYKTPTGEFPLEPLAECRPDSMCLCSYVRVVESQPERIVVHWRHVPDPASVVMTEVVHEYFAITPDGKVRREVRVGTTRLDDFNDPANVTVQQLQLADDGVTELSRTKARRSIGLAPAVAGSPLRQAPVARPAVWLRFDDGLKPNQDQAQEAVKGTICPVVGNKTLWKQGVSGTALAFDGYFSKVTLPKAEAPGLSRQAEPGSMGGSRGLSVERRGHCPLLGRAAHRPRGIQTWVSRSLHIPTVENGRLPAGDRSLWPSHVQTQRSTGRRGRG